MSLKKLKPALLATGTGSDWKSLAASNRENSATPAEFQQQWLAARYGLAAHQARLVASLVFGEARA